MERTWCGGGDAAAVGGQWKRWSVPHSHVADKNQEGHPGEQVVPASGQTAQPKVPVLGNKASQFLAVKTSGGWGGRRNSWSLQRVHLKDP